MNDEPASDTATVLDAADVARLLRLNVDYVRKLSREGVLPAHKLPGGRTFRYFRTEVLEWLRRQPAGNGPATGNENRSLGVRSEPPAEVWP